MYKKNLIILGLLVFTACSQNKPEVKTETIVKVPTPTAITVPIKVPIKEVTETRVLTETDTDFIPEHIRRSRIEVVEHY